MPLFSRIEVSHEVSSKALPRRESFLFVAAPPLVLLE